MKLKIILTLLPILTGCANPPKCMEELQNKFPNAKLFKQCSTVVVVDTVKRQVFITGSVCASNNGLQYLGDY